MKQTSIVQNVLSFFQRIENCIWGDQIVSNKYFASLSIILVALIGAVVTGGEFLNFVFNWDIKVSFYPAITITLVIAVVNIYESIIATDSAKIAILRALLVLGFILASFFLGVLTSVVIATIIAITVAIIALIVVVKLAFTALTGGPRKKAQLRSYDIIDFMTGNDKKEGELSSDGLTFYEKGGITWKRESTSSNDWYRE